MKAKDTVMNDEQIKDALRCEISKPVEWFEGWLIDFETELREIAIAQAEISFKAGIKEVVEWIKSKAIEIIGIPQEEWQAKLKEWKIENINTKEHIEKIRRLAAGEVYD